MSFAARFARPSRKRDVEFPVVIGSGSHPFPFRTRKLSLIPPMVLYGKLYGRVGRCRHYLEPASFGSRAFVCTDPSERSGPGVATSLPGDAFPSVVRRVRAYGLPPTASRHAPAPLLNLGRTGSRR